MIELRQARMASIALTLQHTDMQTCQKLLFAAIYMQENMQSLADLTAACHEAYSYNDELTSVLTATASKLSEFIQIVFEAHLEGRCRVAADGKACFDMTPR